ncbi:MAG: alpha/beta hydrolase [Deltaproteobacteria bacterium]
MKKTTDGGRFAFLLKDLRFIPWALVALMVCWGLFSLVMYVYQDNMIFSPQPILQAAVDQIAVDYSNTENVELKMQDGTVIRGWIVKNNDPSRQHLLIYFGGNMEEVSHMVADVQDLQGWSIMLMNYRGYGQSQGQPSEKALFSDALEIYDYSSSRMGKHARIVAMGRSLGTGVAVYLAQNRRVDGVILATPYDSISSVAQEEYPLVPIRPLIKHPFDSISRAPSIKAPLLMLIATNDTVIPNWHSRELLKKWGGSSQLAVIQGADHGTIIGTTEYWDAIKGFLQFSS